MTGDARVATFLLALAMLAFPLALLLAWRAVDAAWLMAAGGKFHTYKKSIIHFVVFLFCNKNFIITKKKFHT